MREKSEVSRAEMVMIISLFRDEVFINKIKKRIGEKRTTTQNTIIFWLRISSDEMRYDATESDARDGGMSCIWFMVGIERLLFLYKTHN